MSLHIEILNPILDIECPICFESLLTSEHISFTGCNHKYHLKCLNEWKQNSCPELIYCYKCPTCDELREIDIDNSIIGGTSYLNPCPPPSVQRTPCLCPLKQFILNIIRVN